MLAINNSMKQITITRGDSAKLKLKVKTKEGYYEFNEGDIIKFRVYKKKALNESPVLEKTIIIEENISVVSIELTSEDTKIGDMVNKPVEYWYEVELNGNITLIGYSEEIGAPIFMLLPEGSDI